jgi:hypothetical protein
MQQQQIAPGEDSQRLALLPSFQGETIILKGKKCNLASTTSVYESLGRIFHTHLDYCPVSKLELERSLPCRARLQILVDLCSVPLLVGVLPPLVSNLHASRAELQRQDHPSS